MGFRKCCYSDDNNDIIQVDLRAPLRKSGAEDLISVTTLNLFYEKITTCQSKVSINVRGSMDLFA